MPTKTERVVELPAGLLPLLTMPELETFYKVSDWTVLQWIKAGMPVEPMRPTKGEGVACGKKSERQQRRFDLNKVREWHAEHEEFAATA